MANPWDPCINVNTPALALRLTLLRTLGHIMHFTQPCIPHWKEASQQTGPWHELKVEWNWCSHSHHLLSLVLFRIVCCVAFPLRGLTALIWNWDVTPGTPIQFATWPTWSIWHEWPRRSGKEEVAKTQLKTLLWLSATDSYTFRLQHKWTFNTSNAMIESCGP